MTTPITKERLIKIQKWRETYGAGSNVVLPADEAEELARIALAAMDAEPVAYKLGRCIVAFTDKNGGIPLYTAPPTPVAPDGWKLVPVEPTLKMIKSGANAASTGMLIPGMYRAMLASAPRQEGK